MVCPRVVVMVVTSSSTSHLATSWFTRTTAPFAIASYAKASGVDHGSMMCSSGTIIPAVAPDPEIGLDLVDGVAVDDLGVHVSVGRGFCCEFRKRCRLLVVPCHEHGADLLDGDAH